MNKLRAIRLFVRLADLGSFTRVAEQTNSSKSLISKEIGRLEESLGARLLHRSTRNLRLTDIGKGYLERARAILAKVEEAENFVQDVQQQIRGKLKINIPMALGLTDLASCFADFMRAYPEVELDIHLSDENIDLVEQGFDLGLHASSQPVDSNYVGRPLTYFKYRVCAAANYFDDHPAIKLPQDLIHHNCFVYSYFKGKNNWPIEGEVSVNGTLKVNSTLFMMEAIKQNLGLGFIPDFVCNDALKKGEVIEVLKEFNKPKLTLYALYPVRHFVPANVVQCINFLEQSFTQSTIG